MLKVKNYNFKKNIKKVELTINVKNEEVEKNKNKIKINNKLFLKKVKS